MFRPVHDEHMKISKWASEQPEREPVEKRKGCQWKIATGTSGKPHAKGTSGDHAGENRKGDHAAPHGNGSEKPLQVPTGNLKGHKHCKGDQLKIPKGTNGNP